MARRRTKAKRRRSPKTISVLNTMESLTYANILSEGMLGTNVFSAVFGKGDIAPIYNDGIVGNYSGLGAISLTDMIQNPQLALGQVQSNFMSNYRTMAVNSIFTSLAYRGARRLLRKPIANVNRNIMKELGLGVRI